MSTSRTAVAKLQRSKAWHPPDRVGSVILPSEPRDPTMFYAANRAGAGGRFGERLRCAEIPPSTRDEHSGPASPARCRLATISSLKLRRQPGYSRPRTLRVYLYAGAAGDQL